MSYSIDSNLEFCEIINAFPILIESLEKFNLKVEGCIEGESFKDFFLRNRILEDEIDILIASLNSDLRYYLKKGELPHCEPLRDEREVLILDDD